MILLSHNQMPKGEGVIKMEQKMNLEIGVDVAGVGYKYNFERKIFQPIQNHDGENLSLPLPDDVKSEVDNALEVFKREFKSCKSKSNFYANIVTENYDHDDDGELFFESHTCKEIVSMDFQANFV